MKLSKYAFGIALAGLLSAGPVWAANGEYQPTVAATPAEYDSYYAADQPAAPSPSDEKKAAPAPAPAAEAPAEEEKKDDANPCGEPWTLQSYLTPCLGENTQWKYGGWIEAGVTGNDHGVVSLTGNLPVAFNYASDGVMLNQAWAFAERTAKTDGCGMDWGFRADYIFGTDAFFTQAFGDIGYDNNWDASLQYGSA
ncbi:MAG: porin, partial [Planctomycetia bacterium]|nr:porin [Planctomycetia bacterium]